MGDSQLTEGWLLGTYYGPIPATFMKEEDLIPKSDVDMEQRSFTSDLRSKPFFSYRRGFEPIPGSKLTTDAGWGCMLRSGQMMLGAALLRHFLGPKWRLEQLSEEEDAAAFKKYRMIMSWFADRAGSSSPYSIHNMASKGAKFDRAAGQWHGPTTTALILKVLVSQHSPGHLQAYVSQDGTMYWDAIEKLCARDPEGWDPVVIMIPVRLGVELNQSYLPFLSETFKFPQSLGFIGGKMEPLSLSSLWTMAKGRSPKADRSMYFVGVDGHQGLYYMDPHVTQEAFLPTPESGPDVFASCHAAGLPKKTPINTIDPSIMLGFYCRNKEEFQDLWKRAEAASQAHRPAVFTLGLRTPIYTDDANILAEEGDLSMKWSEDEGFTPYSVSSGDDLAGGNPRPREPVLELVELVHSQSINGNVLGALVLTQGFLLFEPLKQDILVRKNGPDIYRWWISAPFLTDCRVMENTEDIEDRNSDDFILIHDQVESEEQPSLGQSRLSESSRPRLSIQRFPKGTGAHPNLASILHGVDAKALLMSEMKTAVNWCHFAYIREGKPLSRAIPETVRVVDALQNVFEHGLKEKSNMDHLTEQFAELRRGKTPALGMNTTWTVIEKIITPEHLNFIAQQPLDDSDLQKARAFFRLALNHRMVNKYLSTLLQDHKAFLHYYGPNAILSDSSHCEVLKTLFSALEEITFELPMVGFDLSPEEEDNQDLSTDDLVSFEKNLIPALSPPSQVQIWLRNGPHLECFDIEVWSDKVDKVCQPILATIEASKMD